MYSETQDTNFNKAFFTFKTSYLAQYVLNHSIKLQNMSAGFAAPIFMQLAISQRIFLDCLVADPTPQADGRTDGQTYVIST